MIDHESQAARRLLTLAGRRGEADAERCRLAFDHLAAAARMRRCLRHALARHQLSELQFAILVLLSEAEPEPIPMAVLASHASVSRSAITDALDSFEASGLASRSRARRDRRIIAVRITAAGRAKVEQATDNYLHAAARGVEDAEANGPCLSQ